MLFATCRGSLSVSNDLDILEMNMMTRFLVRIFVLHCPKLPLLLQLFLIISHGIVTMHFLIMMMISFGKKDQTMYSIKYRTTTLLFCITQDGIGTVSFELLEGVFIWCRGCLFAAGPIIDIESGDVFPPELDDPLFKEGWEYHAFWDYAFVKTVLGDNNTFLISEPTFGGSPSGVDFFEMHRRNIKEIEKYYDYDPFGILIPLVNFADGVGFFHCNNWWCMVSLVVLVGCSRWRWQWQNALMCWSTWSGRLCATHWEPCAQVPEQVSKSNVTDGKQNCRPIRTNALSALRYLQ